MKVLKVSNPEASIPLIKAFFAPPEVSTAELKALSKDERDSLAAQIRAVCTVEKE